MAKLEAEVGTSPESEKESSSENIIKLHEEARKPRRLKSIVKVSVAAAAIAVMVVAMGISAGAKREYRYVVREKDRVQNKSVLNNVDVVLANDKLEQAYAEISQKTNIQPLKLAYIPSGMKFVKADIGKTWATLYFEYNQHWIKIFQRIGEVGNSVNVISDRKKEEHVYNDLLKQTVYIEEAEVENAKKEYSSCIVKNNIYYQISGVMSKKDFKKIVENLILEK